MLILSILLPVFLGLCILLKGRFENRKVMLAITGVGLAATAALAMGVVFAGETELMLFSFGKNLDLYFHADGMGRMFAVVVNIAWVLSGIYAFEYMKHEKEEERFFGFYLMVHGTLNGLVFAGGMVTYYLFYELMTLLSVPLILHNRSKDAIKGGLKYLFYSLFGAYMVLFGVFFLNRFADSLAFLPGGTLNPAAVAGNEQLMRIVAFSMIIGFSVKAGMFPLHAWLPTAHPIAPAPASAVMSGIIVKMGILGMIRSVYYLIGADFIRGTWVQTVWLCLALLTVFMGSMLAYREKVMKKRLAYSTVSQASYILFGLALLQPQGMIGALLHVVFHAVIKSCLFLSAGAIIYKTHKTKVEELRGIGKQMPVTIWCYTFAAAALIGIPPASGFISKWYLATGALDSGIEVFSWLGPVVLLTSALLTAGYLLPITVNGFLPGADYDYAALERKEPNKTMLVPLLIFAALAVLLGVFPNQLIGYLADLAALVL